MNTKEKILNAAKNLFYNNGYNKTTTRRIASEVNIVHSNIFYYYKNKRDVAYNIYTHFFANLADMVNEIDSNLLAEELLIAYTYTVIYFLSYNEKFQNLYIENADIICKVIYNDYAKVLFAKVTHSKSSEDDIYHLFDLYTFITIPVNIVKLKNEKEIRISNERIRNYLTKRVSRVLDIDPSIMLSAQKRGTEVARKIDYSKLNIFDANYVIRLNDVNGDCK